LTGRINDSVTLLGKARGDFPEKGQKTSRCRVQGQVRKSLWLKEGSYICGGEQGSMKKPEVRK